MAMSLEKPAFEDGTLLQVDPLHGALAPDTKHVRRETTEPI